MREKEVHLESGPCNGVDVVVAVHDAKTRQEVLSRLEKQERAQSHRIPEKQLTIATIDGGYNAGKTFIYRLHGKDKMAHEPFHDFVFREIKQAVKIAKVKDRNRLIWLEHGDSILSMMRKKTAILHESQPFQISVATLIIAGFCIDLAEAQVLPAPNSELDLLFFRIDLALTAFFVVEFAINLFAKSRNWFEEFLGSKHDMFDLVIVMISVLAIAGSGFNPNVSSPTLRLLRLVRVLPIVCVCVCVCVCVRVYVCDRGIKGQNRIQHFSKQF